VLVVAQLAGTGSVGLAALLSTRLVPAQRGALYAVVAAATLSAVLGGLSLDTVLLLPASHRHRRTLRTALAASLLGSGVVGALVAVFGSAPVIPTAVGALFLTGLQLSSAQLFRQGRRLLALGLRGLAGLLVCTAYVGLLLASAGAVGAWIAAWLLSYGVAVLAGLVCLLRVPAPPEAEDDDAARAAPGLVRTVAAVHTGVGAQMVTARLDQVLLARQDYLPQLGQYSLAASAVEFAQAGAMVSLQSILSDDPARTYSRRLLARTWAQCLLVGVAVLALSTGVLAGVGRLSPSYADTLGYVPLLGAASLLACTSKVGSAFLVSTGRPHLPAAVAVAVAVLAATLYAAIIPGAGAYGAAIATLAAAAAHATATAVLAWRGATRWEPSR
jgi:O-antigen/teichoic acid export membrane protein